MDIGPFLRVLTTTFFKFYLLALGCLIITTLAADLLISHFSEEIDEFQTKRFLRAACLMTEAELMRYPQAEWPSRIQALNREHSFYLSLHDRSALSLTEAQTYLLNRKQITTSADNELFYFALGKTNLVLTIVRHLEGQENTVYSHSLMGMSRNTVIRFSSWFLISALFCILLWHWGRPIFRDMKSLRKTVYALSEGDLGARQTDAESELFKPLATTLNSMADRIQHLINVQKELSSAISHELRTPIARLHFISEMVGEAENLEECQRLSQIMESDLEDLDQLLDSSLTYSRFERDNLQLNLAPLNIPEWLEEQVDTVRILAQHIDFLLDMDMLPPNLTLLLDESRMGHTISNLLRNAIKYTHSKIQIHACLQDNQVLIHIDDDGIGIPPHEREYIFTAFTRLDRSRDRATGGHGLGLAICRRVMELHGGHVKATESPLGGARFTMSLPLLPIRTSSD